MTKISREFRWRLRWNQDKEPRPPVVVQRHCSPDTPSETRCETDCRDASYTTRHMIQSSRYNLRAAAERQGIPYPAEEKNVQRISPGPWRVQCKLSGLSPMRHLLRPNPPPRCRGDWGPWRSEPGSANPKNVLRTYVVDSSPFPHGVAGPAEAGIVGVVTGWTRCHRAAFLLRPAERDR